MLTGVTSPADLLGASEQYRPSYLAHDLAGLLVAHPAPRVTEGTVACGEWVARARGDRLHLGRAGGGGRDDARREDAVREGAAWDDAERDGAAREGGSAGLADSSLDALRCLCVAAWIGELTGCVADDDAAQRALADLDLA